MTLRSLCIVSREYPPESAFGGIARMYEMLARSLAARGVAVHVLSLAPDGVTRSVLQDGTAVHRLADAAVPPSAGPDIRHALWAERVAGAYRALDAVVGFDVVLSPEYGAQSLKVVPGPHTALVVRLATGHALVDPARADFRVDPAYALVAEMERATIARADAVLAPSRLIAQETGAIIPHEATVLAPIFDVERCVRAGVPDGERLELVYSGRLEPRKAPEVALHCVAELSRRGVPAHLTLVGRDTPTAPGGSSYRETVLEATARALKLDTAAVTFAPEVDFTGVLQHLSRAHAAVLPSHFESFHAAAVEALALGVPVFCGERTGLGEWIGPDDGLVPGPVTEPTRFATAVADRLLDPGFLERAGARGAARVHAVFSPQAAAEAHEEFFATLRRPRVRRGPQSGPRLGIVMLAHNAVNDTRRAISSVLWHTTVPFRLVVVDNASTDSTPTFLRELDDPRVVVVSSPINLGVPGGRNAGLDELVGDEEYVVFLDNDVEVLARWWEPFVHALAADPANGLAGDDGVRVRWHDAGREIIARATAGERCDIAVGYCLFCRPDALARIGRFDERLGLFWHDDDDLALRAARVGASTVAVQSGRVLHFGHRSSSTVSGLWESSGRPSTLSDENQRRLADKRAAMAETAGRFVAVADAGAVVDQPGVLSCWARAFTAEDPATLVLYGPGLDPESYVPALEKAAGAVGFDLEHGPALLAKLPPEATVELADHLADQAMCWLGPTVGARSFAHLAQVRVDDPEALREFAADVWSAVRELSTVP